jgi:hypothetical protein
MGCVSCAGYDLATCRELSLEVGDLRFESGERIGDRGGFVCAVRLDELGGDHRRQHGEEPNPNEHQHDSDDTAGHRVGNDVSVADRGDGDNRPPDPVPERMKSRVSISAWTAPAITVKKMVASAAKRKALAVVSRRSA